MADDSGRLRGFECRCESHADLQYSDSSPRSTASASYQGTIAQRRNNLETEACPGDSVLPLVDTISKPRHLSCRMFWVRTDIVRRVLPLLRGPGAWPLGTSVHVICPGRSTLTSACCFVRSLRVESLHCCELDLGALHVGS